MRLLKTFLRKSTLQGSKATKWQKLCATQLQHKLVISYPLIIQNNPFSVSVLLEDVYRRAAFCCTSHFCKWCNSSQQPKDTAECCAASLSALYIARCQIPHRYLPKRKRPQQCERQQSQGASCALAMGWDVQPKKVFFFFFFACGAHSLSLFFFLNVLSIIEIQWGG